MGTSIHVVLLSHSAVLYIVIVLQGSRTGFTSSNFRRLQCRCLDLSWLAVELCDSLWRHVNAASGVQGEI